MNIYVIGCGGIGGFLIELLPMAFASASLDIMERGGVELAPILSAAGNVTIPSVVDRLVFVDGDDFNARNALRQGAGAGNKLLTRMRTFKDNILTATWLQNMMFKGYNKYISPQNMEDIIPKTPPVNAANTEAWNDVGFCPPLRNTNIVILCVDNAKTRYEVSKYMEGFDNCLVLNGGNDKTTGHVTIYERRNGIALDPNIMDIYPNITPDADRRPDEVECGTVAPAHDQIAVTNSFIANTMVAILIRYMKTGSIETTVRNKTQRNNEILVDIDRLSMISVCHPL